ncbi:DUF7336 domain-containing protein [Rhodopirellula sallentina]|uniref:DUF7336 domain-containing protein n=1 Tax=Rhodopirellula sallentina SM41 TaxID=1263870 RepID=M5TYN8_9BACT|nr:hypothetical protein [Rhodopirellula sallentina]EMI54149.1 hypothetical protein RSSM_04419 [Rhodopirellula sallentina SM41]
MTKTFILQHEHEWCDREDVKFIGVYATHDDARAAMERLRVQPGFRDWPDGFSIAEYEIGVDHWTEGFVTMINILVPSRTNAGTYLVAGSAWRPGDFYEIVDVEDAADAIFGVGDVVQCAEDAVPGHGDCMLVAKSAVQDSAEP